MFIIAGLGNPGRRYVNTRHNIGFDVIDVISAKHDIRLKKSKHKAVIGEGKIADTQVVIAKPQTFMNLSGESICSLKDWYKADNSELIVIYDDISLPVGKLRLRAKGSDGGHNGIKNIILSLNSDEFGRIKIGVGNPQNPDYDIKDYVLGKFSKDEINILIPIAVKTAEAVEEIIRNGMQSAMNKFN